MRAFAEHLGMHNSHLLMIINGKRRLSVPMAYTVAQKLGLNKVETEYFTLLAQYEIDKLPVQKKAIESKLRLILKNQHLAEKSLDADTFEMVKEWYHMPILEMTELKSFDFTASNISKRLGITTLEAEVAIDRLVRLGFITKNIANHYSKTDKDIIFRTKDRPKILYDILSKCLELGQKALKEQFNASTNLLQTSGFAFNEKQIGEAEGIVKHFIQEIGELSQRDTNKTGVYHLNVHLFKLG